MSHLKRSKLANALLVIGVAILLGIPIVNAQSNHSASLTAGGTWHLHKRIPLGSEALELQRSHRLIQILATAEAPQFEGWSLQSRNGDAALVDVSGKLVKELPHVIHFRVTATARDKVLDSDPLPIDSAKDLNEFLLDMHFTLQIFRGMEMRELQPATTKMIGIPADESSDERIYRTSFDVGSVRPDDRIVLLVSDGDGKRISKFHLEFL